MENEKRIRETKEKMVVSTSLKMVLLLFPSISISVPPSPSNLKAKPLGALIFASSNCLQMHTRQIHFRNGKGKAFCEASSSCVLHNDDLEALLQILPSDLHHNLLNQTNRAQLLEVVLDLGRFPEARYLGQDGGQYIRNTEVTVQELEYAQQAVGEFGKDNRAGIEGTLHRISAIRSRKGGVVGMTCRVGRAVSGQIDMVYDLLQYGKSILFVGRPGVGKTTVMREIACVLSDQFHKRVVIVDTSNEIGGDGNIPHAAIGGARRMQVPEPSMQHRVMVEAVENHMPEVIIVDEIGTEAEAHACRSIAERGIMLIGTAHGQQLENIMKNPILSDLIGGIETVTLGDAEARARSCQKTILERKAPPTFDFLIEMRDMHYWLTHQTDKSVDMLLRGKNPQVEGIDDFSFSCKHTEDNEFANDDSGEEDADSGQGVESVDDDDDSGQGGVESDEDDDDSADEEESLEEEDSPEDQQSTEDEDSGVKQEIEDEESVFDNLKDVDFKTINNDQVRVLVFADIDAAYAFYNEYAKMNGFSIRKNKRGKNKKKQVTWQQFVCSCEGFRQAKYMNLPNRQREQRVITRFGCGAEMRVALDARSGRWHVSRFSDVHNHQLLGDKYVGLLRSHRRLSVADIAQFDSMRKSGISVPQIYGSFASQSGGYHMVAFRKKEMYNWIEKERRMQQGDVKEALKFLQGLLAKDPTLFWSHKVGEDGRLLHLFWCDGGCQIDYEIFGDVLAFDATYGRNKYKCPVVVFSGVNHHKQTCVFGCGIVSDEKEDTYAWLLEQFLQAMKGKAPQCVITDGDMSMRNAIAKVLPDAHHRLCGWHLIRNVTTNVGDLRFTQHFKKCMLGNIEVHDFENRWFAALEEYGLMDNVWVRQLYNKKLMWATAHIKGKFFAGMRTTSRCESLHAHMGKYVQSRNTLADFVYHFQRYLEYIRTNEIEADFKSEYGVQLMQTDLVSLERFASDVYTRELFSIFRKRLLRSLTMNVMESIDTTSSKIFIVGMYGRPALKWQVSTYPLEEDIRCSCLGMESDGLPCVHIIRVLVFLDFDHIPECLVVDRWTKAVKAGVDNRYYYGGMSSESAVQNGRYTALLDSCRRLCFNASKNAEDFNDIRDKIAFETEELVKKNNTIIAGDGQSSVAADEDFVREPVASGSQPRAEGRPGSGQSIKKKVRCSCCKVVGHTRKTCPHARRIGRLVNSDNGASSS